VDHENHQLILYRANTNNGTGEIEKNIPLSPEILKDMRSRKKGFYRDNKAYLPLVIKSECVGAIMMSAKNNAHTKRKTPTEDETFFLKLIADKASMQIENRMLYESLFESVLQTLTSLIIAINRRDMYTEGHCHRVAAMCLALADGIGASDYEKDVVRVVAPIHDVGKVGIPDAILLKPDKLTDEEYGIMKSHSSLGEEIINRFDILANEARITRHHHERFDGRGYPDGLAGQDIPYCSSMSAVCDTYDAMVSDRPYRKGLSQEETLAEIERCRNKQLDPEIAGHFVEMMRNGYGRG
jgi:HD-GYP domain-containing protein (c-di-GMP phosphodiesterase class II)